MGNANRKRKTETIAHKKSSSVKVRNYKGAALKCFLLDNETDLYLPLTLQIITDLKDRKHAYTLRYHLKEKA